MYYWYYYYKLGTPHISSLSRKDRFLIVIGKNLQTVGRHQFVIGSSAVWDGTMKSMHTVVIFIKVCGHNMLLGF